MAYRDLNPQALRRQYSPSEARKEYARQRKNALRRLKSIGASEFKNSDVYRYNVGEYDLPASKLSDRELYYKLSQISKFTYAKRGTLSGLRAERKAIIARFQEKGYDFVTKDNFDDFMDYLAIMNTAFGNRRYDSDRIVTAYEQIVKKDVPKEKLMKDFRKYVSRQNYGSKR